jgi:hypothetical protein
MSTARERIEAKLAGSRPAPAPAPTAAPQGASDDVGARLRARVGKSRTQPVQAPTAAPEAPAVPQGQDQSAAFGALGKGAMASLGPAGSVVNAVGLDNVLGGLDAGSAMLSGMVAEPVAGLAGLAAGAFEEITTLGKGSGLEASVKAIQATREALTRETSTERGADILGGVGTVLAPVADTIEGTAEFMGDTAYDVTGSPLIAAAFYTAPHAALEVAGLGAGGKAARTARLAKEADDVVDATKALADDGIRLNTKTGAEWKTGADGVAVPNTIGRKLVSEGTADEANAALITNSNKATKQQMTAMTEAFDRRSKSDMRGPSPSQVIGQNAASALTEANNARKAVGKKIEAVLEGPVGQTPVDLKPAWGNFTAQLDELGISPKVNMDTGKVELDFRGSELDYDAYKGAQSLLNDGFQLASFKGQTTLADAHKIKQGLDGLLDAKKLEQGGQLGQMERLLAELRAGMNDAGRNVPEYAALNDQYSAFRTALSSFDSYRPAGVSWDSPNVSNNVGAAMRSASADTAAVNNMLEGLSQLDVAMRGAGAKPFSVDVAGLARYSDFLNGQWSNAVINSMPKGGVLRSSANNAQGAAISAMVGNKFGVANNTAGLIRNGIDARIAMKAANTARQQQALVLRALKED